MKKPAWLDQLLKAACAACVDEVKGKGRTSAFACRWAKPRENARGIWLLRIAPAAMEIAGGKHDGVTGFLPVDADLLALPRCLDEVESFAYDWDHGESPHLTLVGKKGKRHVVVEVYFTPFFHGEIEAVLDVNAGAWRARRADGS